MTVYRRARSVRRPPPDWPIGCRIGSVNPRSDRHIAERRYGTFTRSFVLPRDVEADDIAADFESGVLKVTIPKSEKARRRRIEIGGSSQGAREVSTGGSGSRQREESRERETAGAAS